MKQRNVKDRANHAVSCAFLMAVSRITGKLGQSPKSTLYRNCTVACEMQNVMAHESFLKVASAQPKAVV